MSKNKIITASLIIIFILAFYFLTKGSVNTDVSDQTSIDLSQTMSTLSPSSVTELQIEDIEIGTGSAVKSSDTVSVNYLGTFEDGTKFDSSYDRNQSFEFQVGAGQVIQGWDQGLIGMQIGGKRKLTIPYQLAYGENGYGPIPAKATLIFEIELLGIK